MLKKNNDRVGLASFGSVLLAAVLVASLSLAPALAADRSQPRKDARKAPPAPTVSKAAPSGAAKQPKALAKKEQARPSKPPAVAKATSGPARKANAKAASMRKPTARAMPSQVRVIEPGRPSIGQAIGLHAAEDPLDLKSSVALVIDQATGKTLFEKNSTAVLPIASITKLMTAVVVQDAKLPGEQLIEITQDDIDTERNSRSRLRVGSQLTRNELLQLALMASENRAAHALGRAYPGGMPAFVAAMNAKAKSLGMVDSHFVEPTGLSSANVSTGSDLAILVRAAGEYPNIRTFSTATDQVVEAGQKTLNFRNTNRLIASPDWTILVSKTGYISEAGNCLVMQAKVEGRAVILVLLDAVGKLSRFADAQRLRTVISRSDAPLLRPQAGSGS